MNLLDRLIMKANTVKLAYGGNVFIISNETGRWAVEGQEFPSLEAAQEYIDGLLPDDAHDSVVIINDLGPDDPAALKELALPDDWLERIREENMERIRKEHEAEMQNSPPKKDRQLI